MAEPSPLVLLYHRIAACDSDPFGLAVSPRNFREHLEVIAREWAVSLETLADLRSGRTSHDRLPLAVTFDDGYADAFSCGLDLLEEAGVPATFFIAPGLVGRQELWWDELERLLLQSTRLPDRVVLKIGDHEVNWWLGEAGPDWPEHRVVDPAWRAWSSVHPSPRHALYGDLWRRLQAVPLLDQRAALSALRLQAEEESIALPSSWTMSADDLFHVSRCPSFAIGAHSVTHPRLSSLTPMRQIEEVHGAKRLLEEAVGRTVAHFAYPYGGAQDYTRETVAACQLAGYTAAFVNGPGPISKDTDPYKMPRLFVLDWSGEEFASALERHRARKW